MKMESESFAKGRSVASINASVFRDGSSASDFKAEKHGTVYDQTDMARMGKVQEFRRNFRFVPIFAFAAVLMITWEGIFNTASYVLPNGGLPAMVWLYLVSFVGFGAAVVSMAEMASMAPTSGGQYHWVSEFAPPSAQKILSYVIGWFCVLGWQAGVAGQCFTVGLQVQGLITLNKADYHPQAWHVVLLTIAAASVAVVFNTAFARQLPLVEALMLVLHLCGFVIILVVLWSLAPRHSSSDVWLNFTVTETGWSSTGLATLVGLTSSIFALIGPDSAVHMAEEVQDASLTIPRAMIWTLVLNGVTGFAMAVTFAYCLGPLDATVSPRYNFAFIGTFLNATDSHAGTTFLSCIITTLTLCSAIGNVATASRQLFAFARDKGFPFGRFFSHVAYDIPVNAVVFSFLVTTLLSLINLGSETAFNAILSIGVVALLSSYLVSMSCILLKRIRGQDLLPRRWSLSPVVGYTCNIVGIAYLSLAYIFAFFPLGVPVNLQNMNWASAVYGGVAICYSYA